MDYGERPADCPDEIDAKEFYGGNWPADKPFPITPLEAWWILQGYAVRPIAGMKADEMFYNLPGKFEMVDGYIMLWRT